jgi:hypothetical protein
MIKTHLISESVESPRGEDTIRTYIHTHTYTHTHTQIHTYTHTYTPDI